MMGWSIWSRRGVLRHFYNKSDLKEVNLKPHNRINPPAPPFWPGLETLWRWEGGKKEEGGGKKKKKKSGPFVASDVLLIL